MVSIHYHIDETITYRRFSIIDYGSYVTIEDDREDNPNSDRIIIKRDHLPKMIEILTKILNGDEENVNEM